MQTSDVVSVEFPSNATNATNGLEITTNSVLNNPIGYTGRSFNGSVYSSTSDPPALIIRA
jgi:hypothetical protein